MRVLQLQQPSERATNTIFKREREREGEQGWNLKVREESLPVESGSSCRAEARTSKKGERESTRTFPRIGSFAFGGRRRPLSVLAEGGSSRRKRCSRLAWSTTALTPQLPAMGRRAPALAGRALYWRRTPSPGCGGRPTSTSVSSTPWPSSADLRVSHFPPPFLSNLAPLAVLGFDIGVDSNACLMVSASMSVLGLR